MKFFTPDLYIRYNSQDDTEADRADDEWERNLRKYKTYLSKHSKDMNERVRELACNLDLHDAELLSIQESVPAPPLVPPFIPLSVATILVRNSETFTNLIYFLWSKPQQSRPDTHWPFSKQRTHWLYDELEVERQPPHWPLYWHKILWSDGIVTSVPFFDVIVQSFPAQYPEAVVIAEKRG